MTPAPHIITTIRALMADYPASHTARVVDALKRGPRVTVVELAKLHKVSRRTVWAWIKSGKIPQPLKQGRKLRYWDYMEIQGVLK